MKRLFLFLSLLIVAETQPADAEPKKSDTLTGINEWESDPQSDLMGLLLQAKAAFKSANQDKTTEEELNRVQENWITLQSLLMDDKYAETFTAQNNYAKAGFKQDVPLEIVAGVDKPEEITVKKANLYFNKLKVIADKIKNSTPIEFEDRQELMTFYNKLQQSKIVLPLNLQDKEKFVDAFLNEDVNPAQLQEKTELLMKVMRQGNAIARDPLYIELYKASTKGILPIKILEYKDAADTLKIDLPFVMSIPMACKMATAGEKDQIKELLTDARLTPPEDLGSLSAWQRAAFWAKSWIQSPVDTFTSDAPEESFVEVETNVDTAAPLNLSFIKFEDADNIPHLPINDYSEYPEKLKNLVTLFIQQTKIALQKKYDLIQTDSENKKKNAHSLEILIQRWENLVKINSSVANFDKEIQGDLKQILERDPILTFLHQIRDPEALHKSWIKHLHFYNGACLMHRIYENSFIRIVIEALEGDSTKIKVDSLLKSEPFDLSHNEDKPTLVHQLQRLFKTVQEMLGETENRAPAEGAPKE